MQDIFKIEVAEIMVQRIHKLNHQTQPIWGKMNVAQMLAHCNVTYEMVFSDKYPKPNALMRWLLKRFVKEGVVGLKPYKKGIPTAKQFNVSATQDFDAEKQRLIEFLHACVAKGRSWFDGRESHSFGALTADEWNVMFYKHLDHHLTQFGV